MLREPPQQITLAGETETLGEESPTELAPGTSMETATRLYIAQLCRELALMAAKSEFNILAQLLFDAEALAKFMVHTDDDPA